MSNEKMFEFIKNKTPYLSKVISVKTKDYDDENGYAYEHFIVECELAVPDTSIPVNNFLGRKNKTCIVDVKEYLKWIKNEESIKWI